MAKYRTKKIKSSRSEEDSGYESGYESDGETEYSPVRPLGEGSYAKARLFQSKTNKAVAVLNPVNISEKESADIGEATTKHRFFKSVYPDKQTHLFRMDKGAVKDQDYRLVIPYIDSVPYENLIIDSPKFQRDLFLSAIKALKDCHDKGMVVLDLKADNIYYDSSTKKSTLIDGGLSVPIGKTIDPDAFQKSTQAVIETFKRDYEQIPPECWSVRPKAVLATPKMDVFCLGILMYDILESPSSEIQKLIDSCLMKDPEKRPTLAELQKSLTFGTIEMPEEAEETKEPEQNKICARCS